MPMPPAPPAKPKKTIRAIVGVLLCALGLFLVLSKPRAATHTFRVGAGGCRLVTDITEPDGGASPQGYVVLLHGLAASKHVMSYMTAGFTSQGLRVFVPDLPGHGRTTEPFSFERCEQCTDSLLRELIGRGLIEPERTLLVGHSMGGAIALRVASSGEPVAGVIAVSPAPMRAIDGLPPETIPYHDFGRLPSHTLVLAGAGEPHILTQPAQELVASAKDPSSRYQVIPYVSHVSILFSAKAVAEEQRWAAAALHIERRPILPSHRGVMGLFAGLVGIIMLVGPFLRELLEPKNTETTAVVTDTPSTNPGASISTLRIFLEFLLAGIVGVVILHFWSPLRFLRLFEGDYFAGLLLLVGLAVLAWHARHLRTWFSDFKRTASAASEHPWYVSILFTALAALLLCLLFSGWFDLSFTEAWPTSARLLRFLPLLVSLLPYHLAEEFLLGPAKSSNTFARLAIALSLRLMLWLVLVGAIFFLHSGQLLPVLLAPFFALFCLGQRWAMDVVRSVTRSASAAGLFGAILLSGFCLVVFPTT